MSQPQKTPLQRIWAHISWIIGGKGYGAALSLIYLAIVTRSLGPEGFGSFSLVLSTTLTLQLLLGFNVWQVLVKYGNQHMETLSHDALARLVRFCTLIDLISACLGIVLVALILWFGRALFGMDADLAQSCFIYAVIFFLSIRNVPRGLLRLRHRFFLGFAAEAVVPTVKFFGALFLWWWGPSVIGFLLMWAAAELASTIVYWILALRLFKRYHPVANASQSLRAWRENQDLPALLVASKIGETAWAVGQQLPVLLVGSLVGVREAGLYRLANQLAQTLVSLSGFLNLASFTEMAALHARDGAARVKPLFWRLTALSLALAVAAYLLLLVLGRPLIDLMSGAAFEGAWPYLQILGAAACFQLVGSICEPLLMAVGHAKRLIAVRLLGTGLLLALILHMTQTMGALGAAWAKLIVDALVLLLVMSVSMWAVRVPHRAS